MMTKNMLLAAVSVLALSLAAPASQTQTVNGANTYIVTGSLGNMNGGINSISITTGFNNITQNSVNVGAVGRSTAAAD
jgi:hypothetical protein